jgi:plasmid stability protein
MALGKTYMAARVKKRTTGTVTNRESDKVIVRLPEGMRAALAARAASNGRSMTAEVVAALSTHLSGNTEQETLAQARGKIDEAIEALVDTERSLKITMQNFEKLADKAAPAHVATLDAWIKKHAPEMTRPEAIGHLVELGMKAKGK